jgi:hypothetical protein
MVYEVEQNGQMRKIFSSSDSRIIDIDIAEAALNLIDERRAKKLLLKKGQSSRCTTTGSLQLPQRRTARILSLPSVRVPRPLRKTGN